jgi:hypothetical protein
LANVVVVVLVAIGMGVVEMEFARPEGIHDGVKDTIHEEWDHILNLKSWAW